MTDALAVLIAAGVTTLGTIIGAVIQARAHRNRLLEPKPMRAAAHDPSAPSPRGPVLTKLSPREKYIIVALSIISAIASVTAFVVAAVPIAGRHNWLVVGQILLLSFVTGGGAWSLYRPFPNDTKEVLRWRFIAWVLGQTLAGIFTMYFVWTLTDRTASLTLSEAERAFTYATVAVLCYMFFNVALTILIRPGRHT